MFNINKKLRFKEQLHAWESTLLRIQQTIEEWLVVQSQWLYLDPIFSSPNIIEQMPDEAALFKVPSQLLITQT